ncbi:MAG: NGG1p interacting factor NIF3 [Sphingobacteriales bacterium BACL12 MAG-120802-bin5]|jgi:dinuclear metal center YbgI/SA1388 family protein|nr:MAG: NGG1p interacting factor NIF3 [Sphingobacteriales bacterium BACL12 MAG-120802-bin5]
MSLTFSAIQSALAAYAPFSLQEDYDNAGLLTGAPETPITGILITLDTTEAVIDEAIAKNCNLVVSHHPVIFGGLRQLNGKHWVERTVIKAIQHNIGILAAHTNLDNVIHGVNGRIAAQLGLDVSSVLRPMPGILHKLTTFVPEQYAEQVRQALFSAGGGAIGAYDNCSFNISGTGTFRPGPGTNPFTGEVGVEHSEKEVRIEIIFEKWKQAALLQALLEAHPYEEVAYDIYPLLNTSRDIGAGILGTLASPCSEHEFLQRVKERMKTGVIRHTAGSGKPVRKVAICGGAGSFLLQDAMRAGADCFLTADVKYHDFFEAENKILFADIGHYESEQYTAALIKDIINQKIANFAPAFPVYIGEGTNPVKYF